MRRRSFRPLSNPSTNLARDDKIRCVGVVVLPIQLLGKLNSFLQNLVIVRRPLRRVELRGIAEVHSEGYPVVVNSGVEDDAPGFHVLAEAVDPQGLEVC